MYIEHLERAAQSAAHSAEGGHAKVAKARDHYLPFRLNKDYMVANSTLAFNPNCQKRHASTFAETFEQAKEKREFLDSLRKNKRANERSSKVAFGKKQKVTGIQKTYTTQLQHRNASSFNQKRTAATFRQTFEECVQRRNSIEKLRLYSICINYRD